MKSASTFKYLGLVAAATLLLAGCATQTPTNGNENVNATPTPAVSATPSGSPTAEETQAGEAEDVAIEAGLKAIDTEDSEQELTDIEAELQ